MWHSCIPKRCLSELALVQRQAGVAACSLQPCALPETLTYRSDFLPDFRSDFLQHNNVVQGMVT